ncbi:ROK family transcriptional regulator [Actinomadura harenae]|uniref:ROK family transcriptional regulator n=1 Tax=Actinomadura harenae TaxID=2483351 RepID=UPI0013157349|nr:ROK family transcriptional regulator [Actinomadura harenae]
MADEGYLAGPQALLGSLNARAVLDALDRSDEPRARPDLVRATGLSKPTVTKALDALLAHGVVSEAGIDTDRRGPAATLYTVDPGHGHALGVQIGHRRVRVCVIDLAGAELSRAEADVGGETADSPKALADAVARTAERACTDAGIAADRPAHAVVGVPAIVGADRRTIRVGRGLPRSGEGLVAALDDALPVPFVLENDANLAALAERRVGTVRDLDDFVVLRLGTGLGAGVFLGGRLHRGIAGGAGEVGFLPQPGVPLGESVLARRTVDPDGETFARAAAGDAEALAWTREYARALAQVVAAVSLIVEPGVFVVNAPDTADGPDRAGGHTLVRLVEELLAELAPELVCQLRLSGVPHDTAVLGGAGWLARDELKERLFAAASRAPLHPRPPTPEHS